MSSLSSARRLLLVGWDGADSRSVAPLLAEGALPHLARLQTEGASGELPALLPPVPALQWTSLATGQWATHHGVLASGSQPGTATRRTSALWRRVQEQGEQATVIGWPVSHPAEQTGGFFVSDALRAPLRRSDHAAPPPETFAVGSKWQDTPGLGDTDLATRILAAEEIDAGILQLFVPRIAEVDQRADTRLARLAHHLAQSFTFHQYATLALEAIPVALTVVQYPLVAALRASVLPDASPLYDAVLPGAYRLLDLFLGRLLQLAGPETTVLLVSNGAPPPTLAHGLFVAHGPEVRRGEALYGLGALDVVPTALTLLGLPVPADLPGQVASAVFITPPTVASLGPSIMVSPIDPLTAPLSVEEQWNLARVYFDAKRHADAAALLRRLRRESPERIDIAYLLTECLLFLGRTAEAKTVLESLEGRERLPYLRFLLGLVALDEGRRDAGLSDLRAAEAMADDLPADFLVRLGDIYFRLFFAGDARRVFERAVAVDPQESAAHLGLAGCAVFRRDLEGAIHHANRTVALRYDMPTAHLILGRAFQWQNKTDAAIAAYETALRFRPDFAFVHRTLAQLYDTLPGGAEQARYHRSRFRAAAKSRRENRQKRG